MCCKSSGLFDLEAESNVGHPHNKKQLINTHIVSKSAEVKISRKQVICYSGENSKYYDTMMQIFNSLFILCLFMNRTYYVKLLQVFLWTPGGNRQ